MSEGGGLLFSNVNYVHLYSKIVLNTHDIQIDIGSKWFKKIVMKKIICKHALKRSHY